MCIDSLIAINSLSLQAAFPVYGNATNKGQDPPNYITHIVLFYQIHLPIHTNRAFSPDQLRIGTTYHFPSLRATILTLFQRNCKHCMELNNCNFCNYVAKFIL